MIVVFALVGFITGWFLNITADYLVRFASTKREAVPLAIQPPALWRVLRHDTQAPHFVTQLAAELFTASLFTLIYALSGNTLWLVAISAFFILIALMDYKFHLVLNVVTYPAVVLAFIVNVVLLRQPALHFLLGVGFAFGLFYLTALVRPNGLGGGDVKLAALTGAILGFPQVLWALIAGAAASAIVIAALLLSRRLTLKDSIPYAPFLCLGTLLVMIHNAAVIG
jgi:leader peptidase (prepilin peptidase)/N-methyltransferase